MSQLKPLVQVTLAAQPDTTDLPALATVADRVTEWVDSKPMSDQFTTMFNRPEPQLEEELSKLKLEVAETRRAVAALEEELRAHSRTKSLTRSWNRNQTLLREPRVLFHGLCWYHYTFWERARKCMPGCHFSGNLKSKSV
ncbi:hypothetical protein GWI33_003246 [Rhynchophorus ferrugineus]|uniref:Uncharacterized protein n=1 Tax=Rhynchophorus ferrugineus TaxID=354439 RepID=A0A834HJG2_RHYFE|nr:hypothetical protein GWI33_003246 [Rhynchophorus ferrugineus]